MLFFYFYELKNFLLLILSIIAFILSPLIFDVISRNYEIHLKFKNFLIVFLMFQIMWLFVGISLYFFILAFNKKIDFFYTILIFPISYNAGILSLIAPAGIGVREGVMIFMLSKFFDFDLSNKISVLYRIFNFVIEFLLSFIAFLIYQKDKAK